MIKTHDRRQFLGTALSLAGLAWLGPAPGLVWRLAREHPDPRPGIDASKVLTLVQLAEHPEAISAFDQVREIPQIVDGIRCSCGCASREGFYSLLSCYEGEGMARHCEVCQGTGRMAYRLFKQGKTLQEIRDAVDLRYR
jgi:hypothetical protein